MMRKLSKSPISALGKGKVVIFSENAIEDELNALAKSIVLLEDIEK
jgi:hypothetical protein